MIPTGSREPGLQRMPALKAVRATKVREDKLEPVLRWNCMSACLSQRV